MARHVVEISPQKWVEATRRGYVAWMADPDGVVRRERTFHVSDYYGSVKDTYHAVKVWLGEL